MFGLYSRAAFSGKLGNNKVTAEIEKILSKGKVSKNISGKHHTKRDHSNRE